MWCLLLETILLDTADMPSMTDEGHGSLSLEVLRAILIVIVNESYFCF